MAAAEPPFTPPRGLEDAPIEVPADNPMTAGKIKLGEQLFFDKRLSKTKAMSCETCHVPEKGWTDGLSSRPSSTAASTCATRRRSTSVAYYPDLYWDGRAKGLEAQILAAWKGQMGADPDAIAKELEAIPAYKAAFETELGGPPTGDRIVKALATLRADDPRRATRRTTADRGQEGVEKSDDRQGLQGLLRGRAAARSATCRPSSPTRCSTTSASASTRRSPTRGAARSWPTPPRRRSEPAPPRRETLQGAFKTPTLRGVGLSGPTSTTAARPPSRRRWT